MTLSTKADTIYKQILLLIKVSAFGIEKRLWQKEQRKFLKFKFQKIKFSLLQSLHSSQTMPQTKQRIFLTLLKRKLV